MPALGGGHSRHHFHTMAAQQELEEEQEDQEDQEDGMDVDERQEVGGNDVSNRSRRGKAAGPAAGRHAVCIDVLSRAVHCYLCDEYVISDEAWLDQLRSELIDLETKDLPQDEGENEGGGDVDVSMEDVGEDAKYTADDKTDARMSISQQSSRQLIDDEGASAPMSMTAATANANTTPPGAQLPPMPYPPSPLPRRSPRLGPLTPPGCAGLRNLGM